LRWLWKCHHSEEIFASCIDVEVVAKGNPTQHIVPATTNPTPPSNVIANGSPTQQKPPAPTSPTPSSDAVANGNPAPALTNPAPSSLQFMAPITTPAPTPAQAPSGVACSAEWQQCGGKGWAGPFCCKQGLTCDVQNQWYAQCKSGSR